MVRVLDFGRALARLTPGGAISSDPHYRDHFEQRGVAIAARTSVSALAYKLPTACQALAAALDLL